MGLQVRVLVRLHPSSAGESLLCHLGHEHVDHVYPSPTDPSILTHVIITLRSPGEEGVLEGQDRKSADSGGTDPESCQKTHAEPPLVNGHHDVR